MLKTEDMAGVHWCGEVPKRVRKSFLRAIEPYVDLLPYWCRTLSVQVADPPEPPHSAGSVAAEREAATATLTFILPSDWEALGERDQELALVFWLAVDDVSRSLAAAASPVVDAVRDLDRPTTSGSATLYDDLLPYIGPVALEFARHAVAANGRS